MTEQLQKITHNSVEVDGVMQTEYFDVYSMERRVRFDAIINGKRRICSMTLEAMGQHIESIDSARERVIQAFKKIDQDC